MCRGCRPYARILGVEASQAPKEEPQIYRTGKGLWGQREFLLGKAKTRHLPKSMANTLTLTPASPGQSARPALPFTSLSVQLQSHWTCTEATQNGQAPCLRSHSTQGSKRGVQTLVSTPSCCTLWPFNQSHLEPSQVFLPRLHRGPSNCKGNNLQNYFCKTFLFTS